MTPSHHLSLNHSVGNNSGWLNPETLDKTNSTNKVVRKLTRKKRKKARQWAVLEIWEFIKFSKFSAVANKNQTYSADSFDDNIAHFQPSFKGKHLKQSQHGILDVVKIEISRICPAHRNHTWQLQLLTYIYICPKLKKVPLEWLCGNHVKCIMNQHFSALLLARTNLLASSGAEIWSQTSMF